MGITIISQKREFLKYIAIITMCVDHIGAYIIPDYIWLQCIGRLAFPIYAYLIASGYDLTRNRNRYLLRLTILACLSQLGYAIYEPWYHLNVIFIFCLAVAALQCWELNCKGKIGAVTIGAVVFIFSCFSLVIIGGYGIFGFLAVISFRIIERHKISGIALFVITMTALPIINQTAWFMLLALLALPVIWYAPDNFKYRITPYVWRLFYPLHCFLLTLAS